MWEEGNENDVTNSLVMKIPFLFLPIYVCMCQPGVGQNMDAATYHITSFCIM